ncbi:MAG: hypothetical protein IT179_14905 [Acidobacteria bacterium]|nr:hypothetical protein [Acidobacteriota bacterium]
MRAALALALVVGVAAPGLAQPPEPAGPANAVEPAASGQVPAVDATRMGVSLSRIQKQLRVSAAREQASGTPFRLEYQVQVYGAAPRIDVIEDFDISAGAPLRYGAPTHQEFLNHWTPQAFRSPAVPFSALAGWALFQLVKRADKSKCEQEIAEYRALVMQGVPAAAPRCTQ